jgi:hypothetical protein
MTSGATVLVNDTIAWLKRSALPLFAIASNIWSGLTPASAAMVLPVRIESSSDPQLWTSIRPSKIVSHCVSAVWLPRIAASRCLLQFGRSWESASEGSAAQARHTSSLREIG